MTQLTSRFGQTVAGALNASHPIVSWESSWDETQALETRRQAALAEREEHAERRERTPGVHLQASALGKRYGGREVLHQVQLDVRPGEFIAIVGRSGCGKSTLLRLVAGLETASTGQVRIDENDAADARDDTRIMFQDARLLPWLRVLDNVTLGLPASARERGREVLAQVGLADRESEWPARLSGGQRQRVALARALVHQPRLLLLDEPLGALDALTRIEMHRLIEGLWRRHGFTALLVTHDVQEAVALADRVVLIEDGRIALDETIALQRPRSHGDPAFAALEERILDRVLQKPDAPASNRSDWPGVPAHGLRWAV
jgi:sulfonate transport system ATP-binding protein